MAQTAFYKFCASTRLSAAPNPTEIGRLQDGSEYRITTIGVATTMVLHPVGGTSEDSGSGVYIRVATETPGVSAQYLLKPSGRIAEPVRPWAVKPITGDYLFAVPDPPVAPGFYTNPISTVDISWHARTGKNYLVGRHPDILRKGSLVATNAITTIVREAVVDGEKAFYGIDKTSAGVFCVKYAAAPFALDQEVTGGVYLLEDSRYLVRAAADTDEYSEFIHFVRLNHAGDKMLMVVTYYSPPEPFPFPPFPDPRVDSQGRHSHSGVVYQRGGYEPTRGVTRMVAELSYRGVGDRSVEHVIEEYALENGIWSRTGIDRSGHIYGACTPTTLRANAHSPTNFSVSTSGALVVARTPIPPAIEITTSTPNSFSVRWQQGGTATLSAWSEAVFDEYPVFSRFTQDGGVVTISTWGNTEYRKEGTLNLVSDQYRATVDGRIVSEYQTKTKTGAYSQRRRTEEGLVLGSMRMTTYKADVTVSGSFSEQGDCSVYWKEHPLWAISATGSRTIAVVAEHRHLIAYEPFLDLVCYVERTFSYSNTFSTTFQKTEDMEFGETGYTGAVKTFGGDDCFLPDAENDTSYFVLECRGSTTRIQLPISGAVAAAEDADAAAYSERLARIPWLDTPFKPVGPRPGDPAPSAGYTELMRENIARGGLAEDQQVSGRSDLQIFLDENATHAFGAMEPSARAGQTKYAADPKTGGAVLWVDLRYFGADPVAFAIDKAGARPIESVLPGISAADITVVGSA